VALPLPVAPPAAVLQLVVDNTRSPEPFTSAGELGSPEARLYASAAPAFTRRHALLAAGALLLLLGGLLIARWAWPSSAPPEPVAPRAAVVASAPAEPATPPALHDEAADEGQPDPAEHHASARARARQASKLVSQGHSFRRAGLLGSARRRYTEALDVFPDYPRALAGLAQVALAQGKSQEALDYARRLRKERPRDAHYQKLVEEIERRARAGR
jgi:tetratricopeptide (TPR) repeat protein